MLTKNEIACLKAICSSHFRGKDDLSVPVWSSYDLLDDLSWAYEAKSHPGVLASLVKKGFIIIANYDQDNTAQLTDIGIQFAKNFTIKVA